MSFDPVPYFVGGGAEHSAEIMRTLAYLATGGQEGIIGPLDLRVVQDSPPGGSVLVMPGAGVVVSKYPNIVSESYILRNRVATALPVTATGAGAGRSDLVIARVLDPHVSTSGDPNPPSIANGPYVEPQIISNVPNTTKSVHQITPALGYTAITLARIDIPVNTGTITQAMIKDLRSVANSATRPQPAPEAEGSDEAAAILFKNIVKCGGSQLTGSQTSYQNWPSEAVWTGVQIPKWCTHVAFFALVNPRVDDGDITADWRLTFDGVGTSTTQIDVNYEADLWNAPMRDVHMLGGVYTVPTNQRGTAVTVRSQAKSQSALLPGKLIADNVGCHIRVELEFLGVPTES